jgi:RimJ/RimL family protein N-acetyltransferase
VLFIRRKIVLVDVALRNVIESDLPIFFEHQLDPEATRMADFPPRDTNAFMNHWSRILADDSIVKKTILIEGKVAGNIVSFIQDGEREVGYWLGKEFWRRGIATQALIQFLEIVEERPLIAHVAEHNAASIRVLEKCGFLPIRKESGSFKVSQQAGELKMILGAEEDRNRDQKRES